MSDTIIRIKDKTSNFTVVCNEIFQRSDLSAKAKGVFIYLMTLPDDWKVFKSEVYTHFTEGRSTIDTAFKELEMFGYIRKEAVRGERGRMNGWKFTIYESPIAQFTEIGETENRRNRKSDKQQLQSTDTNKVLKEQIYTRFLEKWNTLGLVEHTEQVVKSKWKNKHTEQVKLYGEEKVFKAMENYATIIHSPSYFFDYKWPLWDFIARGLDKFVDDVSPLTNFKSKKIESKQSDPYAELNL